MPPGYVKNIDKTKGTDLLIPVPDRAKNRLVSGRQEKLLLLLKDELLKMILIE